MNKIALIHCGCHKTGSTTIQHILKKNEKNIEFYIPKTYRLNYYPINHALLAWDILKDQRFKNNNFDLSNLKDEIKDKKKIMLSSEDFALVLSNEKTKKKFENIFSDFKIIYLCLVRSDKTRDLSLLNEFRYHYKFFRKLNIFKDFFNLKKNGFVTHKIYKSFEKCYYYTNHKLLIKKLKKNSKGKFFFIDFNSKNNVLDILNKISIFKNITINKNYLNLRKKKKIYNLLKLFIVSKEIYINKNRNKEKIEVLNKFLKN
tara:strand:+ start:7690 stop:8466 length:777 start_codon:yes stop_codon:yes gene_type:complete